jgi:hypothetical protein
MKMKRKTDLNETKLQELRAKALRRGDRLANTLRKLAAKGAPNDASVEPLLKALEQVLPRLRRLAGEQDDLPANQDAGRVGGTSKAGHELSVPPKSRSRKAKRQPAPALAGAE